MICMRRRLRSVVGIEPEKVKLATLFFFGTWSLRRGGIQYRFIRTEEFAARIFGCGDGAMRHAQHEVCCPGLFLECLKNTFTARIPFVTESGFVFNIPLRVLCNRFASMLSGCVQSKSAKFVQCAFDGVFSEYPACNPIENKIRSQFRESFDTAVLIAHQIVFSNNRIGFFLIKRTPPEFPGEFVHLIQLVHKELVFAGRPEDDVTDARNRHCCG
ncbi:hypothetical protein [Bilophila wadsworthia]|uniref:hypothetical protein n=1 Tax=Bilophila wadsworthia TaxID=35833 RepID=UPI003AF6A863